MNKKLGAILLIAGTCIGSGMIALPMVLAKLGLIPSIFLMFAVWFVMYYTSLINLELNLQATQGMSLGELGKQFSGNTAKYIGTLSVKLLSYSLLAVFIYGGSSITQKLLASKMEITVSREIIASSFAAAAIILLLCPIRFVDYINRILFVSLLGVVAVLVVGLALSIQWTDLPLFAARYDDPSAWTALLPIVFTSFGFQVIFHTMTHYCDKNAPTLKRAFFWGTFIPTIVYILWTCSILSAVHHDRPLFYTQMVQGTADVGDLIQVLSGIAKGQAVQLLVWSISLLAIITSIIGVGVGLCDSLKRRFKKISHRPLRRTAAALATVLPAYIAVLYIPNAFLTVLGFAGMILAVIAIILPVYLFFKAKTAGCYFEELRSRWLTQSSMAVAALVIACEVYNMLYRV